MKAGCVWYIFLTLYAADIAFGLLYYILFWFSFGMQQTLYTRKTFQGPEWKHPVYFPTYHDPSKKSLEKSRRIFSEKKYDNKNLRMSSATNFAWRFRAGTWRLYIIALRSCNASTLSRRCINVLYPLGLRVIWKELLIVFETQRGNIKYFCIIYIISTLYFLIWQERIIHEERVVPNLCSRWLIRFWNTVLNLKD